MRTKHANGEHLWSINGKTGKMVDTKEYSLYESGSVKTQTRETTVKVARVLLRVDDVVQATREDHEQQSAPLPEEMEAE
ncbi:hypothetical protein EIP86_001544 [Pleurotus ostreatoroseus]|nr:hypothetical protein EIP86_001544 [Pleurotus ostreatoroseus]